MRVIPIEKTIPAERVDKDLRRKLLAEAPGILNWIIAGCLAWQGEGLGDTANIPAQLPPPTRSSPTVSVRSSPSVARSRLTAESRAPPCALPMSLWAEREGEHPINPRDFAEQLRQRNVSETKVYEGGSLCAAGAGSDSGTPDTLGQQFLVNPIENLSRETNWELVSSCVPCATGAPSAAGVLGNCTRVRPGTTATPADVELLQAFLATLNGTAQATLDKLWDYWKSTAAPSVGDFWPGRRAASMRDSPSHT